MYFQEEALPTATIPFLEILAAGGFGIAVGLFIVSNVGFRSKPGFQTNDLVGLIVIIIGGALIALFPVSSQVFFVYGFGVFIGVALYLAYRLTIHKVPDINLSRAEDTTVTSNLKNPDLQLSRVSSNLSSRDLSTLRKALQESFNQTELQTLCFDLGLDFENLPGEGKDKKVIELINYMGRRGELPLLVEAAQQERPNIPWGTLLP